MNKEKTDPILGKEISQVIKNKGVETPFKDIGGKFSETVIAGAFMAIMREMQLDMEDDSLMETPRRVAKMYVREVFYGLNYRNFPKVTLIENRMAYGSFILERDIKVHSFCEHHFVPFIGKAYVAYIPKNKVIGLSKINRIVDFFARRPQVQERLGEQIYEALCHILETDDVAVVLKCEHLCVKVRGVEDNSDTVTSRLGGAFYKGELRTEFMGLISL